MVERVPVAVNFTQASSTMFAPPHVVGRLADLVNDPAKSNVENVQVVLGVNVVAVVHSSCADAVLKKQVMQKRLVLVLIDS